MKNLMFLLSALFLLSIASTSFSDDDTVTFTKEKFHEMRLSHNFFAIDRDSSAYIHSLEQIKTGNAEIVAIFMEYQLDEMIIAAWKFKDDFTEKQNIKTIELLRVIKKYRENNPRDITTQLDPREFSKYYGDFDPSYSERADEILNLIN